MLEYKRIKNVSGGSFIVSDMRHFYEIGFWNYSKDFTRTMGLPATILTMPPTSFRLRGCNHPGSDYARYLDGTVANNNWMFNYGPYEPVVPISGISKSADVGYYTVDRDYYLCEVTPTGRVRKQRLNGADYDNQGGTNQCDIRLAGLIAESTRFVALLMTRDTTESSQASDRTALREYILILDKMALYNSTNIETWMGSTVIVGRGVTSKVYEDNNQVILYMNSRATQRGESGSSGLLRFDKNTGGVTSSFNAAIGGNINLGSTKPFVENGKTKFFATVQNPADASGFLIKKIPVETTIPGYAAYNWANMESITIEEPSSGKITTGFGAGNVTNYGIYSIFEGDTQYIVVLPTPVIPLSLPGSVISRVIVYRYDQPTNSLKYVWHENIPVNNFIVMPNSNARKFLVASQTDYFEYAWNGSRFVKSPVTAFGGTIGRISYTADEQLWFTLRENRDIVIHASSQLNTTFDIQITSDKTVVSGPFPAASKILVKVFRKSNNQLAQESVEITAINAKFVDNDKNVITVTTSADGPLEVPILIQGSGPVKFKVTGY